MTDAQARARRHHGHVLLEESIRSQLGFRGAPSPRPGETHPRASDVFAYNDRFYDAIGCGFPLADALDHARRLS